MPRSENRARKSECEEVRQRGSSDGGHIFWITSSPAHQRAFIHLTNDMNNNKCSLFTIVGPLRLNLDYKTLSGKQTRVTPMSSSRKQMSGVVDQFAWRSQSVTRLDLSYHLWFSAIVYSTQQVRISINIACWRRRLRSPNYVAERISSVNLVSPSLLHIVTQFSSKLGSCTHIRADPQSCSAECFSVSKTNWANVSAILICENGELLLCTGGQKQLIQEL